MKSFSGVTLPDTAWEDDYNPILDDDEDETRPRWSKDFNPVLDEDEDEGPVKSSVSAAERAAPGAVSTPVTAAPAPAQDAKRATHNPLDDRLGNLSGAPKATSHKKKTDKKYRRRYLTASDLTLMKHLALFKMSNSVQLGQLLGVHTNTAHRRLLGLQEAGLVGSNKHVLGVKLPWYVTGSGLKTLETIDDFDLSLARRMREADLETAEIGHYLAIGQVAIQLLTQQNPLRLPKHSGNVSVEDFVTEFQIDSAWQGWLAHVSNRSTPANETRAARDALLAGVERHSASLPEFASYVALTNDRRAEGKQTRMPDLVLKGQNAAGVFAIEVETSVKPKSAYKEIIGVYLNDTAYEQVRDARARGASSDELQKLAERHEARQRFYSRVVWVCNSTRAAKRIEEAAEELGLLDESFLLVRPLLGWDGKPYYDKAWRL